MSAGESRLQSACRTREKKASSAIWWRSGVSPLTSVPPSVFQDVPVSFVIPRHPVVPPGGGMDGCAGWVSFGGCGVT